MIGFYKSVDPRSKAGKVICYVLMGLGAVLLIAAVILLVSKINRLKGMEKTEAVIIAQDEASTSTVVSYRVDGEIYRYRFSEYSSGDHIGDTIKIAYDKNAPDRPYRTGFMGYFVSVVIGFFGIVCSIIGWTAYLLLHRKPKKTEEKVPWEMT